MKVYFVRHGETAKNKEKRLQGRSNAPLNEKGICQVSQVRDYFRSHGISFDAVYSSPLLRALQTAEGIVGNDREKSRIIRDERLVEMDYGPYEGSSLETPAPEIVFFFSDFTHNPAPAGMESLEHVQKRLGNFLEDLKNIQASTVLVTTHAIAMKGALEYLTPESKGAYWSKPLGNCAVYETELMNGEYSVPQEICGYP